MKARSSSFFALFLLIALTMPLQTPSQRTQKPILYGKHRVAVTGKPIAATAGAMIFQKGGNAIDAAVAMIAATCTMWDTLSWGGETQALIYNPHTKKVIGINALGVAPTGATAEFYRSKGMMYPPEYGPLAAVTPGTPGGIMTMLAEYGKLSLKDVLAPAIEMADGYAMDDETSRTIEKPVNKNWMKQWKYSKAMFYPHLGESHEGPLPGEVFKQPDLAATLRKLVDAEQDALKHGTSRKEAIMAAYDRFYKGDIAQEFVRGVKEEGGLITLDDLANWRPHIEEPVTTNYKGIDVYKLNVWTQGPAMLQALNILENFDLKSMGYNSPRYINTIYQAMSLAFADRDFYYGDIYSQPAKPIAGLLSKEYAKQRAKLINPDRNVADIKPGNPYHYQADNKNPFQNYLDQWKVIPSKTQTLAPRPELLEMDENGFPADEHSFYAGTTSVEASDAEGWVVSVTPSGGWVPAVIAGHTGVGLSQRAQSFVTDPADGPFNVIEPGKHPRVTLTPTLALQDGKPYLCFSVQGGDSQDQNLLQFFLNTVEFGFTVQRATEAPNINSFQMRSSFGNHEIVPGKILLADSTPQAVRDELKKMGYTLTFEERTSGPINAIYLDQQHGTMWGGSSNHGDDYGIAW
ncbi:MAG: gamma-glutamyltransferase [Acidobacteria bacterium]|nr:gamma-glutamyltransferase [Acidobacteriota bacterium]